MSVAQARRAVQWCRSHGIHGAVLVACERELRRALADERQRGLWDAPAES
jgi:hypothetical protein